MGDAIRLYVRYVATSVRAQMQYRASFVMMTAGQFLITVIEILGIWALFDRFGSLRAWRLAEVALLYGIIHVAFAIAEAVARGFDVFDRMIRTGEFDRVLLRPRSAAFQVGASELHVMRVGRLAQGLIVLIWAAASLGVTWTLPRLAVLAFAIFGGACLFSGLFVIQATMSFWTVQSLEVMNTVTYGGTEAGQYPLDIYRPWFRQFFTFVVPLACIAYFPGLAILGRGGALHWLAPAVGVVFLLATLQLWRFGVRHYRSTGS